MKIITEEYILNIINDNTSITITLDNKTDNLLELGMDSIEFISLIVALEEDLDVEIPDSKLIISDLNTVEKLLCLVKELQK